MASRGIAAARRQAERFNLRDTCMLIRPRTLDDGAGGSYPDPAGPEAIGPLACAFRAVSGSESSVDLIAERGEARLYLAVDLRHPTTGDALTIANTDVVDLLGDRYDIIWTPPAHALALLRTIGLHYAGPTPAATAPEPDATIPAGSWIGIGRIPTYATARPIAAPEPDATIPAGSWIGIGRIPTYASERPI